MPRIQILLALILSLKLFTGMAALTAPITWNRTVNNQPVNQITSTPVPTPSMNEQLTPEVVSRSRPPLELTLFLLGFCCVLLLLVGVVVLSIVVRRQNQKNK